MPSFQSVLRPVEWILKTSDSISQLRWSANGRVGAAAVADGCILRLDTAPAPKLVELGRHSQGAFQVTLHPSRPWVASAGQDGKLLLLSMEPDSEPSIASLDTPARWTEHLAWSPDGTWLAAAAGRQCLLWSPETGKTHAFPAGRSTLSGLSWSSDSRQVAVSRFGGVDLHPVDPSGETLTLAWPDSLLGVSWSPNGRWIVAPTQGKSVQVWEFPPVENGEMEMSGYPAKVHFTCWDARGRHLATDAAEDIMIWNCMGDGPAGTTPTILSGHDEPLTSLAYAPAGTLLASGCREGRVLLWNHGRSNQPLMEFRVGSPVLALAWHPSRSELLAGTQAGTVALLKTS